MASRSNDAELRFKATLDDDISSKADRLERKLQQMGKSPAEIKMILRAVDEATPKIQEVQKHADKLPREHVMQIRANHTQAMNEMTEFRRKQEAPVKMRFEGLDGALDKMKEMFSLRTKITGPLGAVPGVGQLYGMGAGAGVAGLASAGIGGVAQGVQIQSRMEQSMVTLDQTLKDTGKAREEMRQLVDFAIKTPFNYQDVLAADVRLRSYQIPTMPNDPGAKNSPGGQGWLKASGDMAAAMQTPIQQAVEAVADAKQGYFVRMMTYGIRMMREDFEKGGKYAGLSYEEGLTRALKRFDGSMSMQATTFKGVMSNLQDVLQNKILAGAGAVPFGFVKDKATQLQDKLQTPEMQEKIGAATEKFNKAFVQTLDLIRKGREYFELNLQQPLTKVVKIVETLAMLFAKAFGGTTGFVLKTLAQTFLSIAEAVAEVANKFPGLFQFFGVMKALSMLGFGNLVSPFTKLQSGLNPLTFSLRNIFGGIVGIPKSAMMISVGLLVKGFLDAHQATKTLNGEFKEMNSRGLDKLNADISKMAIGLGVSSTELKNLTSLAASGLPTGKGHIASAERVAELGVAASRQFGMDKKDAVRAITGEANLQGDFRKDSMDKFYISLGGAKSAADELKIKFKDLALAATVFKGATNKVGLEGLEGMPMLGGLMSAASGMQMTDKQARLYGSPTEVVRAILEEGGSPSNETLKKIGSGNLGKYFDFKGAPGQVGESRTILEGLNSTYNANLKKDKEARAMIAKIAPDARIMSTPNPWTKEDFGAINAVKGRGPLVSPDRQAGTIATELQDTIKRQTEASEMVNTITDRINVLSNKARILSAAIESVSKRMSIWQQNNLVPLQRHIEDVGLAVQEYTLNKLRPLERQMNRLSQAGAELSNTMQNAQYDLQKFASGLLPGEQATLDNLHSLERYNKQLQLLQLIHHSMGSELGLSNFRRGFSSRVEPLFGLSLQMQMERAQRKQQRAQLEYELGAGEEHYKLQQAGRSKFERQEMSFDERMAGVKRAVGIIDTTTEAQHKLTNVQHALQRQIFKVNEYLADQGDKIGRMQLNLQKLSQSDKMRRFADEQFDLGIKVGDANKQLEKQNTALARWTEKGQDLKQTIKTLKDDVLAMLDWGDKPEKNAKALAKLAVAAGIITKKQLPDFLKTLGDAGEAAKEGRATAGQWREKKASWVDVVRQGIIGAFTGDLFRKLGDIVKGVTGQQGIGSMISIAGTAATLAIATGVAGVLGSQVVRAAASRLIQSSFAGPALRGAAGLGASALGRLPFNWARGMSGSWARVAGGGAIATGGLGGRLLEQLRLLTRFRSLIGAGVGSVIGTTLGGPPGGLLGGYVGGRVAGGTPMRQWVGIRTIFAPFSRGAEAVKEGAKTFKDTVTMHDRRQRRAIGRSLEASRVQAKNVDNAKKILGDHEKALGRNAARVSRTAGRLGRFGRIFAGAVTAFVAIKEGFGAIIDKVKHLLHIGGDDVDDAARGAGAAGQRLKGRRLLRATRKLTETMPENLDWEEVSKEAERGQSSWTRYLSNHPGVKKWLSRLGHGVNAAFVGTLINDIMQGDQTSQIAAGAGAALGGKAAVDSFVRRKAAQGASKAAIARMVAGRFGSKFIPFVGQALLVNDALELGSELTGGDLTEAPIRRLTSDQRQNLRTLSPKRRESMLNYFQDNGVRTVVEAQAQKFLERLERAQQGHSKKLLDNQELYEKVRKRRADENNAQAERGQDKHGVATLDIMKRRGGEQFRAHDKGMHNIFDSSKGWLAKVAKAVRGIDKDFGLTNKGAANTTDGSPGNTGGGHPSSGSPDVLAHGGWVMGAQIPKGKLVRVGEEGHDEVVIPLAPHRRHRAISLMQQVQGRIGAYASGGIVEAHPGRDMAYITARGAYAQAVQSFANGGLTGPYGSGAAFTPISNFAAKKFGLSMTAGRTNHNVNTTSGNVSDHSWGGAGDFSNGILTPQEDAFNAFWKTKGRAMVKQLIWRNKDQFNGAFISGHENHVHLALQRQYAFDQARMAKILSNLSEGLSIRSLLASAGTGDLAELRLPGVPKKLRQMGPIGRRIVQALRRKKRQWEKSGGGPGGGDFSNLKGGGAALMKAISKREGWNFADWWEVDRRETGHGTNLLNESSGAALRGQFMPGITQGHYGPGSDPGAHPSMRQQIISMARYIKSRYPGGPTEALAHHDKFNWYKDGAYNIPRTGLAGLHRGEMVLPETIASKVREKVPDSKAQTRYQRLLGLIESIEDKIKKSERHLKTLNDKVDKRNQRAELADLNARLRDRQRLKERLQSRSDGRMAKGLAGDKSGGEDTEAGVLKEQQRLRRFINEPLRAAKAALREARQRFNKLADQAHRTKPQRTALLRAGRLREQVRLRRQRLQRTRTRLRRGGLTGQERTRLRRLTGRTRQQNRQDLRRARQLDTRGLRGVRSRAMRRRLRSAADDVAQAETRVRRARRFVKSPAGRRRGTARYIVDAARRGVNHELIRSITGRDLRTNVRVPGRKGRVNEVDLYKRLEKIGRGGVSKEERGQFRRIAQLLERSIRTGGAARKKRPAARKAGAAARRARPAARTAAKRQAPGVSRKQSATQHKARIAQSTRHNKRQADDNKKIIHLLQKIVNKDLTVNIHNEAKGATIKTTRRGGRRRAR